MIAFKASQTAPWVRLEHPSLFLQMRTVGLTSVSPEILQLHGEERGLEPRTLNVRIFPRICCVCPAPLHLQCPPHNLPRGSRVRERVKPNGHDVPGLWALGMHVSLIRIHWGPVFPSCPGTTIWITWPFGASVSLSLIQRQR